MACLVLLRGMSKRLSAKSKRPFAVDATLRETRFERPPSGLASRSPEAISYHSSFARASIDKKLEEVKMDEILKKIGVNPDEPLKLSIDSKFKFRCHKDISCFNKCCSDLDIFLTPFDVLKMKNRLGISSGEFISEYTESVIHNETKLPFIKLKLKETGQCRFVSDEGCTIYTDRPLACRYYPIGFGILKGGPAGGDFYFFVKEEYCKGFEEEREWTVKEWREAQEIDNYDFRNKDWIDIILNKKLYGAAIEPDEKSLRMFFMGSYDVDSFRNFVFESKFLELFDINEDYIELIESDESELMEFAHKWLQYVLFKKPTMILKKDIAKKGEAKGKTI